MLDVLYLKMEGFKNSYRLFIKMKFDHFMHHPESNKLNVKKLIENLHENRKIFRSEEEKEHYPDGNQEKVRNFSATTTTTTVTTTATTTATTTLITATTTSTTTTPSTPTSPSRS